MRAIFCMCGIVGLLTGAAAVSNPNELCFWAELKWAENPFVPAEEGRTAYVTPKMVSRNESGECYVANHEAFFEEEALATEIYEGVEYGEIVIFSNDDFSSASAQFATLEEVETWAMTACNPPV